MDSKYNLLDKKIYVKAALEYESETLPSNHAEDCSTEDFNKAMNLITDNFVKQLKGANISG